MSHRTLPFSREELETIAQSVPTPFHLYDESAIRANAQRYNKAFSWVHRGFKNYFAVKALPNPFVMEVVKQEGMGADCSSLGELLLAEAVGITGEEIMFTSNDTPAEEFQKAYELGAIINLDDISHIDFLKKALGGKLPELLCFRYNPGPLKEGNVIIGKPEEAKYGFTRQQLFEGYAQAKAQGVKRFGLHTMVASNELNADYFVETAQMLFDLALEVHQKLGITFDFINLGGGIGIPYRPEHKPVDFEYLGSAVQKAYQKSILDKGLPPIRIVTENGRMVTGPFGYLVSRVLHKKAIYKNYLGLDASMANLMRPGMYGAYHHISVPGREAAPLKKYDITGSLCENNDKFAVDREIPDAQIGDLVVIHESGAHGHSMGFNYNAKLRSAEILWKGPGQWKTVRHAETYADLFATLDYPALKKLL